MVEKLECKKYVYDLSYEDWVNYLSTPDGPKYRAQQVFDALHKGIPFSKINIPSFLKGKIKAEYYTELPDVVSELKSKDGTVKFLLRLMDGNLIECVLLKQDYGSTVCISTQVGCKMGCHFCASGADGFVRDLSAGEMLAQFLVARRSMMDMSKVNECVGAVYPITNIVLMGSGEPLDNFDNVVKFLGIAPVGARHISLSTAGVVPRIRDFADLGLQVNLCISLHAPTDEVRQQIMPIAKKWSVKELIDSAKYFFEKTRRRVIFEYSLIDGVNCSPEQAVQLAKLVRGFPSHINLINLNSAGPFAIASSGEPSSQRRTLKPPSREVAKAFMDALIKAGASCTMRKSRGDDIMAACGQLKGKVEEAL
jgi:23S rRNA (adenine2503-C2)-methyltransferase